ncbi:ketoacyl-ACP synthase III [candidate division WOR-3 bacterium]|nr:ketoacyl-ACP synthase III [candidate division WOR-3 bacterium]
MFKAKIYGTGSYVPERVITNQDFEKYLDTSDKWITERSGIKERHWVRDDQATSDMVLESSKKAIESSGIDPDKIDMIIVATISPDHLFPSTACLVQQKLNLRTIPAFDISAACTGFIYAMEIARNFIANKTARYILVSAAETLSKISDKDDRSTVVLFGDGAGSVLLGPSEGKSGIISTRIYSDGNLSKLLEMPAGGSRYPASEETVKNKMHYLKMQGNETYKHAVTKMGNVAIEVLKLAGITGKEVDIFIPHQANYRIMESTALRAGVAVEKVYVTIHKYGNMSAATIPVALDEAVRENKIKPGDVVLLDAFGGGLTWGATVLRW